MSDSEKLPKLTLTARPTPCLILEEPYEGTSKFGSYFLYNLSVGGNEMAYFATKKTHEKIQATGARINDEIILTKTQLETGKSWITVERPGVDKDVSNQRSKSSTVDSGKSDTGDDKQKLITSQFLIGRSVDVWVRLNEHDPASYPRADMRLELCRIATDIHRSLNMYMKSYYDKPERLPKAEEKKLDEQDLPF